MFRDVIAELARVLGALGVRWVLVGAVAANVYRRQTRLTGDVDLLLAESHADPDRIEAAFRVEGWHVRRGTPEGDILRMKHPRLGAVDLQIASTDYQRVAIERARPETLNDGERVAVLSVEDVIIHKLIAGRPRDVDDIHSILEAGPTLDENYLNRWVETWEVTQRWADARRMRP